MGKPKGAREGRDGRERTDARRGRLSEHTQTRLNKLSQRLEELEVPSSGEELEVVHVGEELEQNEDMAGKNPSPKILLLPEVSKPKLAELNKTLRAMIANEEQKRSHLKVIITRLRSQKEEHSEAIDSLMDQNNKLSREVLDTTREVKPKYHISYCSVIIISSYNL